MSDTPSDVGFVSVAKTLSRVGDKVMEFWSHFIAGIAICGCWWLYLDGRFSRSNAVFVSGVVSCLLLRILSLESANRRLRARCEGRKHSGETICKGGMEHD